MSFSSQTMTENYKWSATLTSRHPWQRWLARFSYRPYTKWREIPRTSANVSEVSCWSHKLSIFARNGCDKEGWVLMSRQPQVIRVGFSTTDNPPFWNTAWPKNKKHLYDQKWMIKPINSTAKCLLRLKRYFHMAHQWSATHGLQVRCWIVCKHLPSSSETVKRWCKPEKEKIRKSKKFFSLKLKSLISRDTCHHMAGRGHWKWTKSQPRESLRWSHNTG